MSRNETDDPYITDEAEGKGWKLLLGDACERLGEVEGDSVDLAIYSPPFRLALHVQPEPARHG